MRGAGCFFAAAPCGAGVMVLVLSACYLLSKQQARRCGQQGAFVMPAQAGTGLTGATTTPRAGQWQPRVEGVSRVVHGRT